MKKLLVVLLLLSCMPALEAHTAQQKLAALTFDDGPWPKYTKEILDILDKYEIKATFFVIGQHIERYPEILKEVVNRGHVIGNHTYSHPDLTKISTERVEKEISRTEELIDSICPGACTKFLKPPCFYISRSSALAASRLGYWLVFCTIDPADWDQVSIEQIIRRVMSRLSRDVEVITLHDGGGNCAETVAALPAIIEGLRSYDYEFVTIPEIFGK